MCGRPVVASLLDVTPPTPDLLSTPGLDPEEDVARLLAHLRTQAEGLDEREAARRLAQVGANEIRRGTSTPWWRSLLDQLIHPLALLLWVAAALSLITGVLSLAVAIVVVILLNAAFAFAQERQAEHATEALRDLLSIQNRQISVENIQKTVADYYKIKVADMYSKKRPASIARPRQIAMYLAKELTQKSLPEIGELFGGRDHTTVLHAVRKMSAERQQMTELNQQLHVLEQTLKG